MRTFRRWFLVGALATSMGCVGPVSPPAQGAPAPLQTVANSSRGKTSPSGGLLLGLVIVGAYVVLIVAGRGN